MVRPFAMGLFTAVVGLCLFILLPPTITPAAESQRLYLPLMRNDTRPDVRVIERNSLNPEGSLVVDITFGFGEPIRSVEPLSSLVHLPGQWSPDGVWLAGIAQYCIRVCAAPEVAVAHVERGVTLFHPFPARAVAWSPEGSRLAAWGSEGMIVFTITPDTTTLTPQFLIGGDVSVAAWSPDGSMLAYREGVDDSGLLHVVSAAGGAATLIANDVTTFQWAPDSRRIAFIQDPDRLIIADTTGTVFVPITDNADRFGPMVLAWSPDSRTLLYKRWTTAPEEVRSELMLYDGVTTRTILHWPGGFGFLPDGTIYAVRTSTAGDDSGIYLTNDGTTFRPVAPFEFDELHTSPDGAFLWRQGGDTLTVISVATGEVQDLTASVGQICCVYWLR